MSFQKMPTIAEFALVIGFSLWALAIPVMPGQDASNQTGVEVSSVKPGVPGASSAGNRFSPDRASYTNVALMTLIEQSYFLREYQIVNAPDWLRSDRWVVEMKTSAPTKLAEKLLLLRSVLSDRFQLRVHHETRVMPVFFLEVAKGGHRLQAPHPDERPGVQYGSDFIIARKFDITQLASALSGNLNMPVVDNTGLTGEYDFQLRWTPDTLRRDFGDIHDPGEVAVDEPPQPIIFTAIEQQLGLKLRGVKGPVDVIVIDQVEKPTRN